MEGMDLIIAVDVSAIWSFAEHETFRGIVELDIAIHLAFLHSGIPLKETHQLQILLSQLTNHFVGEHEEVIIVVSVFDKAGLRSTVSADQTIFYTNLPSEEAQGFIAADTLIIHGRTPPSAV